MFRIRPKTHVYDFPANVCCGELMFPDSETENSVTVSDVVKNPDGSYTRTITKSLNGSDDGTTYVAYLYLCCSGRVTMEISPSGANWLAQLGHWEFDGDYFYNADTIILYATGDYDSDTYSHIGTTYPIGVCGMLVELNWANNDVDDGDVIFITYGLQTGV